MKIYLSARIIERAASPVAFSDFLAMAADAGYDGVGLRQAQVMPELDEAALAKMRALLDSHGLGVCSLPLSAPPAYYVQIARRLGVKVLQTGGTPEEMSELAAGLDADMALGPQMHTRGDYENVSLAAENLRRAADRRVGVIVEPANLMFTGAKWSAALFEPLRGRIIGCHLQSVELMDEGSGGAKVVLRDGRSVCYRRVGLAENRQIDLCGFLRALSAAGYDGFINVIEPARPGADSAVLAAETAQALRRALAATGATKGRKIKSKN